jgi:hypothetical protein
MSTLSDDPTGFNLGKLVDGIKFESVTTAQVADARNSLARRGLAELEVMLGIDVEGLAEGIARGVWTPVPA